MAITSDSAWVTMLQLWPALFERRRHHREAAAERRVVSTDVPARGAAAWWSIPQLAPWVISSLWFQPSCGAHGVNGFAGS